MGAGTSIEWAHHTFNPWRGCTKVSAGCANCYADRDSRRNPKVLGVWGPRGTRVVAAEAYWKQPVAWNRAAADAGERHRVFCASLADVFEGPETMPAEALPAVRAARVRLFDLIRRTPNLDWLLVTKRPENWRTAVEESLILAEGGDPDDEDYFADHGDDFAKTDLGAWLNDWTGDEPPPNLWVGASVEDQAAADERIPRLLKIPAVVRFLSMEPLLGRVSFRRDPPWLRCTEPTCDCRDKPTIGWVIVGGESGPHARPMHPTWARWIRDECVNAGVPFFFKQWGEWLAADTVTGDTLTTVSEAGLPIGNREPAHHDWRDGEVSLRVGKKAAGRLLDGRTWDEFPAPSNAR